MKENVTYKAKKLFKGFVSVRSNIVDKAISKGQGVVVVLDNQKNDNTSRLP